MKRCVLPIVFVVTFGLLPCVSWAQVILYGCTASLTATPETAKLVDINPMTGLASNPRDIGIQFMSGIAYQPASGSLFGLTSSFSNPVSSLVRIDPITGFTTLVGSTGLVSVVEGDLAFNPVNGQLFGVQDTGGINARRLFQIDPLTGSATVVGNVGSQLDLSALAFDSNGTLYAIDSAGTSNSRVLTLDPSTASITSQITMSLNLGPTAGMTFDPMSGLAYVADGGEQGIGFLFTLDIGTGVLSPIGSLNFPEGLSGLTFVTVPEPSSFLLVGGGTLAFWRWRRSKVVALAD